MKRKPYGKQFSIWVNRCPECGDITFISHNKVNPRLCKKCSDEAEAKHRDSKKKVVDPPLCPFCHVILPDTTEGITQHLRIVHPAGETL